MEKLVVRKARQNDIPLLFDLINGLALYEKRPQDMTGTKEQLHYWLFEKNIATSFIAEKNGTAIGYAIYYPVFGSFSAKGKVHLEDIFVKEEFRGQGVGKQFFAEVVNHALNEGYAGMEWSCLDWNTPAISFYDKLGAEMETGRKYFDFNHLQMQEIAKNAK